MTTWNWIALGAMGVGYLFAIVGLWNRMSIKMRDNEKDIEYLRSSLNLHEQQNEKAFDKVDKKLDTIIAESKQNNEHIFSVINELKTILIKRNND